MAVNNLNCDIPKLISDVKSNNYAHFQGANKTNPFGDENVSLKGPLNQDVVSLTENKAVQIQFLDNEFSKTVNEKGIIGKAWDKVKNIAGFKTSSTSVEKIINDYKDGKADFEQAKKALNKYKTSQMMMPDFISDVLSGTLGLAAFAVAVPLLGAALPLGIAISAVTGAVVKSGVKYVEAKTGGREYKSGAYDVITGSINGALGPLTNGLGNTVIKNLAPKLGFKAVSKGGKTVAAKVFGDSALGKFAENALLTQRIKTSGSFAKRAAGYAAGKGVKQASKLGLAQVLRSIAFAYVAYSNYQTESMYKLVRKISGQENTNGEEKDGKKAVTLQRY